MQLAEVKSHLGLSEGGESRHYRLTVSVLFNLNRRVRVAGQVEQTGNHFLGRHGHRAAIGRLKNVVGAEHQNAGLRLGLRT